MISRLIAQKLNILMGLFIFFGLFFMPQFTFNAYAGVTLPEGESFVFKSMEDPQEVEYTGQLTGQPRENAGANYFDHLNFAAVVPFAYQVQVSGPQTDYFLLDGGFAWNDNFGWISFVCEGGENLGISCEGINQTHISNITMDSNGHYVGTLGGNAWNENIGYIDFSWRCVYSTCPYVDVNFTQGTFGGFAWNEVVGWMYFEGIFEPPTLVFDCGNGTVEPGEDCDDANSVNTDSCTNACQNAVCGDDILYTGNETCDDGNTFDGDGCSSTCVDEVPGSECGNNILEPGEICDEGGDGDIPDDSINDGQCLIDLPTKACEINVCGDGYLWSLADGGSEQCDDGNTANGDGCDSSCNIEPPAAVCGDGIIQSLGENGVDEGGLGDDEECDAGITNANSRWCTLSCKRAVCGDNFLQPYGGDGNVGGGDDEECDHGGTPDSNCDVSCQIPAGAAPPECGDGTTNAGEQCDDGNLVSGDGCSQYCEEEGVCGDNEIQPSRGETCDDGNVYSGDGCDALCNTELAAPICPNYIVEVGEQCDDGNILSGDGCSATCGVETAWCGDGEPNGSEQCDDGNDNDEDTCKNDCTFGDYSVCGDGNETAGEACDDGNTVNGDGCNKFCQEEDNPTECEWCLSINDCEDAVLLFEALLDMDLDEEAICNEYCGNGFLEGEESCDDGNILSGDGCSATCDDETAGSSCGNGITELSEECDDGNNESGDGCNAFCEEEDEILILEDPTCEELVDAIEIILEIDLDAESLCALPDPYCGDLAWNGFEECDWSDTSDPLADYCNFWCEIQFDGMCGDGIQDFGENCDDGNLQDGDGCNQFCESEDYVACNNDLIWDIGEECDGWAPDGWLCVGCELFPPWVTCGNGVREGGEECDLGANNGLPGFDCTASCQNIPPAADLVCFPEIDVERVSPTGYRLYATLNCLDDPDNWDVTITEWDVYDSVDCDQTYLINPDSSTGCDAVVETGLTVNLPPTASTLGLHVGSVSAQAPTGYACPADPENENLYVLEEVELTITDPVGAVLYQDDIPIEYNMEFSPRVAPQEFDHGGEHYLDLDYDTPTDFNAKVEILVPVKKYGARYTLDIGYPYTFGFDVDGSGSVDPILAAPDSDEYSALSQSFSWPNYSGTGPDKVIGGVDFPIPVPSAYVVGLFGDAGVIPDEYVDFVIQYRTAQNNWVYYCADSLPDIDDLRLYEYEMDVIGSISTDKIGDTGFTEVGNVGEALKRRDILRNISRIVRTEDLSPAGTSVVNFGTSGLISGDGDYLEYTSGDYTIYYFKDDVVIEGVAETTNDENRVFVVDGANLYVDNSVLNVDEDTYLEIVVLNGHAYIGPDVTIFEANMVVDGSLFPYDGETKGDYVPNWEALLTGDFLEHQFVFKGSLLSENTIGGSDLIQAPNYFKGDGTITNIQEDTFIYDMNRFRRHGLIPGADDDAGNPLNCDGDGSLEIGPWSLVDDMPVCGQGDPAETSDMAPAGNRWSGQAPDANKGVYFIYRPPSNDSPIFKSSSSVGVGN